MIDTRILFSGLVGLVGVERLFELRLSARHTRQTLARGGVELGRGHTRLMVITHGLFLLACPAEVWLRNPPFLPLLAGGMTLLLIGTMALRYWAVATLGERWCTRVVCLPGAPAIHRGPYRWVRHPNYLAVLLEVPALPLIHSAWITALLFGAASGILVSVRIKVEESGLRAFSDYEQRFGSRPRFFPRLPGRAARRLPPPRSRDVPRP